MPSFTELVGVLVAAYLLAVATGNKQDIWTDIAEVRRAALAETSEGWGCPSVFSKDACRNYDPKRYR